MNLHIALDYDDRCSSSEKDFWRDFFELCESYGHYLTIVSSRSPDDPLEDDLEGPEVFYTDGQAKKQFCDREGLDVDVFIERNPVSLLFNTN